MEICAVERDFAMLQVRNISKKYQTGDLVQQALNDVSLDLRDNEFVSILGPSGSGKTTLLNVIGGLDRYDSGDLIINGTSTREYRDRDWDAYRNHTIGFVFQSYNLIPHQSILANVELALTIGGVSRSERRERAKKALEEVGLGNQVHKRPGQLSGGQMQRVAVARALVNDPDVLLADEPTGALDSETSIQVMELLKRVAERKLVVMVTHNGELAERYSTRIVKLRDGRITDDSNPFTADQSQQAAEPQPMGRAKMSFATSLTLSFNNLWTKKGRTILTAFAGSIGIIGIALILSLSSGVNNYISDIQKSTMTSYPITISGQAIDMSGVMGTRSGMAGGGKAQAENRDAVYASYGQLETSEAMAANIKENNLSKFKKYLDAPDSEIHSYLGENGIVYSYDVHFSVYSYDADGNLVASDADTDEAGSSTLSSETNRAAGGPMANMNRMTSMMSGSNSRGAENFAELMPAANGGTVSPILLESYDLMYGAWPEKYDEVVLVLDEDSTIPAGELYQLGLMTGEEYREITEQIKNGSEAAERIWDYGEVCGHTLYLLPDCDRYEENEDGTFSSGDSGIIGTEALLEKAIKLKITGVIRPAEDAANANLSDPVAYTCLLTEYVISHTAESPVVLTQERTPEINALSGLPFEAAGDEEKAEAAKDYISAMGISEKASLYTMFLYLGTQSSGAEPGASPSAPAAGMGGMAMDEAAMAAAMDRWLAETPDAELLLMVYDEYIDGASYTGNMEAFGAVSEDAPASISIYTDSFEDKEAVSACIERYNEGMAENDRITYTDYVALLTGSVSSIIDVISYVLIAFVAVSLIVSSIMIGIITHISVMERTKEIGILRAMGASKRNISQVFNAETIIIGLLAGVLGVGVSMLLTVPVNSIIQGLLGAADLSASLPASAAGLLVALSVAITVVAGLIPSRSAAKKDPVAALRTE